jgi:hypothetical protein
MLTIQDTGPGFPVSGSAPLTSALAAKPSAGAAAADARSGAAGDAQGARGHAEVEQAGEGIGLSIVKRLCDMLNATVEVKSERDAGTTFQIRFPRQYSSPSGAPAS